MADTWIKMRKKLLTDPRVWAMSRKLEISIHAVLGGLFHLWCIADDHGGNLSALDADTMDEMVRIKGFVSALPECWIRVKSDGIELPEYDEHNGSTGKRRAMETKRRAEARKVSASDADKKQTREEKRREEKATTSPRKSGEYTPDFESWWKHHPRKIEKPNAFREWRKLSAEERAAALDYIEAYAEAWDTYDPDKERRGFCPYPERWLKRHRWQDDPNEWILEARGK